MKRSLGGDMIIEGLERLELEDEGFRWDALPRKYEDIVSIRFFAKQTKHSINFVPTGTTYEGELLIDLKGGDRVRIGHGGRALINHDRQKKTMAAVWQAKEILSEMSFSGRVAPYEESVKTRGFFTYGSYQFHRDGDIFHDGKRLFSIKDPGFAIKSSPFQLHLCPARTGLGKFFGSDIQLSTETDEDCLFYKLRHVYGYGWEGREVRTKRKPVIDPKKVYLTAMVKLAAKLAGADGSVSPEELQAFKKHFRIDRETFPEAGRIFNEAMNSKETPEEIALAADAAVTDSREFREYIVIGLIMIATADRSYHDREHAIVAAVARVLGFESEDLEHILAMCGVHRATDGSGERAKAGSSQKEDLLAYHCRVLKLGRAASLEEIKIAWRKLVQEHHPDRLVAKGVPADDIEAAQEILKAINASYTWLKNLHGTPARA
jgi:DnaJ like chaperone protein